MQKFQGSKKFSVRNKRYGEFLSWVKWGGLKLTASAYIKGGFILLDIFKKFLLYRVSLINYVY